jgi:ankyrin repeat protein
MKRLRTAIFISLSLMAMVTLGMDQGQKDRSLIDAILDGNAEQVKKLIKSGANINDTYEVITSDYRKYGILPKYWTPLMFAASKANTQIADMLIEHGAQVNQLDVNRRSPLSIAVEWNDEGPMIKLLIKAGADVNVKYWNQTGPLGRIYLPSTPLIAAIKKNNNYLVDLLLTNGAQVDATSMRFADQQKNPEIIKTIEAYLSFWQKLKWKTYGVLWD